MLALALGGRSVEEWKACITPAQFAAWREFFVREPFDDFHRYHRPAALIGACHGGGDLRKLLDWLRPDPHLHGLSEADLTTLRTLGFTSKGG